MAREPRLVRVAGKLFRLRACSPSDHGSCWDCAFYGNTTNPQSCCGHPAYVLGYGCPAIHIFHNASGGYYTLVDDPEEQDI